MMTRAGTKSVADCHAVGNISSIDPVSIGPLAMPLDEASSRSRKRYSRCRGSCSTAARRLVQ
jgi:hypothetical protein